MTDNDKISSIQLWIFIVLTIIGVGIFSLPRAVAQAADQDGWIVVLLGGVIALIDFYIISRIIKRFPGDTLVEIARKVLGKYLALPILTVFLLYLLFITAMTLRIFGEVVKMSILVKTPVEVILITLLLLVFWLARGGVEPISRFDEIIFPILISVLITVGLLAIPRSDLTNILPLLRTPPSGLLKGAYQTAYSYGGFEFVLLMIPFIKKPEKAFKAGMAAIITVGIIYTTATILSYAKFGVEEAKAMIWPTLSLIRAVEVPGSFIERLEGIVMSQWVLLAFTTIAPASYGLASLSARMLKHKEFRHLCAIVMPVIYILAMIPDNIVESYKYLEYVSVYLQTPSMFLIPLLLLLVSAIRKAGGSRNG